MFWRKRAKERPDVETEGYNEETSGYNNPGSIHSDEHAEGGKRVYVSRIIGLFNRHWWMMYALAALFFVLFSLILGPDSLSVHAQYSRRIDDLKQALKEENEAFVRDSLRLEGVRNSDLDALEREARERFKMKCANELVFILEDSTTHKR